MCNQGGLPGTGGEVIQGILDSSRHPSLPRKIHEGCYSPQVPKPEGEEWDLSSGEWCSDGSVKWPRWMCLASGGLSVVQIDDEGNPVRWHAAAPASGSRHVAVNTETFAMAAAAVYATEDVVGGLPDGCQRVC